MHKKNRRLLVYGIIMLFIGAGVIPNVSGDEDNIPPEIAYVYSMPNVVNCGLNITITANVTDNIGIKAVNIIIYPFVSSFSIVPLMPTNSFTMTVSIGNIYTYIFSDTRYAGQYNYTIWAVDGAGNSNYSAGHIFNVLDFVPGEFIVKFKEDISSNITINEGIVMTGLPEIDFINQKENVVDYESIFNTQESNLKNIYKFIVANETDTFVVIQSYMDDPNVIYVEPNYIYHTCIIPNDPYFDDQWALNQSNDCDIDAPEAWDIERGDEDIIVAVIDTGVDYNHSDLVGNIWNNTGEIPDNGIDDDGNGYIDDIRGWDFFNNDNEPLDYFGHGTHCSGTISAVTNNNVNVAGVCWNCTVIPIRVGHDNIDSFSAMNGIIYAVGNGADVISMSWGGYQMSYGVKDALDDAYAHGVVLIAAAGNEGIDSKLYPAGDDNVIAVAATTNIDGKAKFSNYGSWVDVAAPGVDILSLRAEGTDMYLGSPGYEAGANFVPPFDNNATLYKSSGTSMSCPHVAGLAALILSKNPNFTPMEIRTILRSTIDTLDSDKYIGVGRINAYTAIQIDNTTIANLDSSLDGTLVSGIIDIIGTANGAAFTNYTVYYGAGVYPNNWTEISNSSSQVNNNVLVTWDTSLINDGIYTVRLIVNDVYNQVSKDCSVITVDNAYITFPKENDFFRAGKTINVTGYVNGTCFQNYTIKYGVGENPTSWLTEGITLTDEGNTPVVNGLLATWNTTSITMTDYYTLKIIANFSTYNDIDIVTVIIDPDIQVGWPVKLMDNIHIFFNSPTIADVNKDGYYEIIVSDYDGTNRTGLISIYEHNGTFLSGWPQQIGHRLTQYGISVGDINNDNITEIIATTNAPFLAGRIYVWNASGDLLWSKQLEKTGHIGNVLSDINNDGYLEIIFQTKDSKIFVLDHLGDNIEGWPQDFEEYESVSRGGCAVADFDNDNFKEIVMTGSFGGGYEEGDLLRNYNGSLTVFNYNGSIRWVKNWPEEPPESEYYCRAFFTSPVIGDVNDDGEIEIVVVQYILDANDSSDRVYKSRYFVFGKNGNVLPGWPKDIEGYGFENPVIANLDDDNELEIIGHGKKDLYVWNHDGTELFDPVELNVRNGMAIISAPSVADVTGDGKQNIVVYSRNPTFHTGDTSEPKIYIINNNGTFHSGWPKDIIYWEDYTTPALFDLDNDGDIEVIFQDMVKINVWDLQGSIKEWPMFQHDAAHSGLYFSPDNISPKITNISNVPDTVGFGFNITISANVTDVNGSGIRNVRVKIIYSDDSYEDCPMNHITDNIYEYVFNTWQKNGQYSYNIWVIDNADNTNSSSGYNFNVSTQCNISLQTTRDYYIDNEYVNLTNSKIDNVGTTDCKGYLQIQVEYNDSGNWILEDDTINETIPRTILHGDYQPLDNIFNGKINTSNLIHESGQYKVYAAFRDPEGDILVNDDDTLMQAYYEFNCTLKISNVSHTPNIVGYGYNVTITADIIDDVNTASVNITYPDASIESFTMNHVAGIKYEYVFNDTWQNGQHNYSIWVIDNADNTNSSSGYNFTVSAQCNIFIQTLKDEYGENEYVNITGVPDGNWLSINSTNLVSYCNGYNLDDALDGVLTWYCKVNHTHWFILDLGQTYTITKVKGRSNSVFLYYGDPIDVNIYVSGTNGNWRSPVATRIDTWHDTIEWQIVNTSIKYGEYVKVEVEKTMYEINYRLAWGATGENNMTIFDIYGIDTRYSINNVGVTNYKGHLQMCIEYNDSGNWILEDNTINETISRTILHGEYLPLDSIFNGNVSTSDFTNGNGQYRVYVAFRDKFGNVLKNDDDTYMNASYVFNYTVSGDNPPMLSGESPINGSTEVNVTPVLYVTCTDADYDTMTATWRSNSSGPWIDFATNTSINNGMNITQLNSNFSGYLTKYWWSVNLTDGVDWCNETYTFTTRDQYGQNLPTSFTATTYNRTQINLTWTKDSQADTTYIEWNTTETWNKVSGNFLYNGSAENYEHTNLDFNAQYFYQAWSWNDTDNCYSSTYIESNDTTNANQAPTQTGEIPTDDSGGIDVNQATVNVTINDPDGDTFNWTIQGSYVTNNASDNDTDGSKQANLITPLPYSTNIIWYVSVTDGYVWTNQTYNFTTKTNILPEIGIPTVDTDPVGYGYNVTINVSVWDNDTGISEVKCDVIYPDLTSYNFTMDNTGGDYYEKEINLTDTWQLGWHNYTVWTTDGIDSNTSSQYSFNVSAQCNVSIQTLKDEYSINEYVNLTDPPENGGDDNEEQQVGYELLDSNTVLHIWNSHNDYYFNTSSGIQLTNHYNEYWSHNVLMLGYYNNDKWNLIYRTDELSSFNKNIETDNETYINATLWKDLSYSNYDFRLAIRYHLGVNDSDLTIIPYIKNLGQAIPYDLAFGWGIKDIKIDNDVENDQIRINGTSYLLNQVLDIKYTNLTKTVYRCNETEYDETINETTNYTIPNPIFNLDNLNDGIINKTLYLKWNHTLDYLVRVKSHDGQHNAPVTLFIRVGTLDIGQEKSTELHWLDYTMWDLQFSFDVQTPTGDPRHAGAEFDGTYFYTAIWNNNTIYRYDINGNLVHSFSIDGVTCLRDLAWDGTYMYGGAASTTIYIMDFTNEILIDTITTSVTVRSIAYDPAADTFWVNNFGSDLTLINREGAILYTIPNPSSMYGCAYDGESPGGPYLWVFTGTGGGECQIEQYNLNTKTLTGVTHSVSDDFPDAVAGGLWFSTDFIDGTKTVGGLAQAWPDTMFCYEVYGTPPPPNNAPTQTGESPINGDTGISITPSLHIICNDADSEDTLTATWRSNSSGEGWVTFATNYSISPGTNIAQTNSNFNIYNTTYYWSINLTDGTDWCNETYHFTTCLEYIQSKIDNIGNTNCKGHLLIQIHYNDSGSWYTVENTINETSTRTINASEYLKLDEIFNGNVHTSTNLTNGTGQYRVYVAFCGPSGNVLINNNGTSMNATYGFNFTSPTITDVTLTASDPLDTEPGFGWENVTCIVTADVTVDEVLLNVTYPNQATEEFLMNKTGDTYYYNTTLTDMGNYTYHIWANDTSGSEDTSEEHDFSLPPNYDVNMDGRIHGHDFALVAKKYGEYGPTNGWIREDVSNNGRVYLEDFVLIANHYGEEWYESTFTPLVGNTIISILPSNQTVGRNETFNVSVYIEPDVPINLVAVDFLYFNSSLIQANSVTEGDLFDPYAMFFDAGTINNTAGVITNIYGFTTHAETVTESGFFCNISFTSLQALGDSDLDLVDILILDANTEAVPITVYDGSVTVQQ